MYIIGPEPYRINSICYEPNIVELISEVGDIRKFQFFDECKELVLSIMNYQNIVFNEGSYIEHKSLLYSFIDLLIGRTMEITND